MNFLVKLLHMSTVKSRCQEGKCIVFTHCGPVVLVSQYPGFPPHWLCVSKTLTEDDKLSTLGIIKQSVFLHRRRSCVHVSCLSGPEVPKRG